MDWYDESKKELDSLHEIIMDMWKKQRNGDCWLLALIFFATACSVYSTVSNFSRGNVITGSFMVALFVVNILNGVFTVRRMIRTREKIRAEELWYESRLNILNNLKEEVGSDGNTPNQSRG